MKIALSQLNPMIGDIDGNLVMMKKAVDDAAKADCDLIVFSELIITGYPPKDFLRYPSFIEKVEMQVQKIVKWTKHSHLGILFGAPTRSKGPNGLYNSAILADEGQIVGMQHKTHLPTYDVFDEARYFDPSTSRDPFAFRDERIGIIICEDAWSETHLGSSKFKDHPDYSFHPCEDLHKKNATLFIAISASPFEVGKVKARENLYSQIAQKYKTPVGVVNQVGGNDDLIFDGNSLFLDEKGQMIQQGKSFKEELMIVDTQSPSNPIGSAEASENVMLESVNLALQLGIKDYVRKCGFQKVVLGLSGGIDSALVATLAAQTLGPENVIGIGMPSQYSSQGSIDDAKQLAKNLGIEFSLIPIQDITKTFSTSLAPIFKGLEEDVTEENLQARTRGNLLMAVSNKLNALLLTTGNKSELAVGYCTLYGDMCGGLAVLSDVPKTLVYKLSTYLNSETEIIPKNSITKPPIDVFRGSDSINNLLLWAMILNKLI